MDQTQAASPSEVVICACSGKDYNARDAIDAALFRGELNSIWQQFLISLKAEAHAEELELEVDHDAIDAAAEAFRYEHDLITAEETERWLDAHALSLEDFTDYVMRQWCRSALETEIEADDTDPVSGLAEFRERFTAELIFSGVLNRLITRLVWRLAAAASIGTTDLDPERIARERKHFLLRNRIDESGLNEWLGKLGRDEQWLNQMLTLEAAYQQLSQQLLTPSARQKQLVTLRMALTQFEVEVIELESGEAAKEAMLCIRQDGMSMEEVAAEARYPFRRSSFLHEAVPEDLKQKFWSVSPGDLVGPLSQGDGFHLYRITRKVEPQPDDPNVQDRVDQILLERHFAALTSEHVHVRSAA